MYLYQQVIAVDPHGSILAQPEELNQTPCAFRHVSVLHVFCVQYFLMYMLWTGK